MKNISIILFFLFSMLISAQSNDGWRTYFEKSNFKGSPDYSETMEYFQRLADSSPFAEFITIGVSPQGRDLKCLIIDKDKLFAPVETNNRKKPVILIQNGIHSGEIEGKDASMLLIRDILINKTKLNLIDNAVVLFIPIFNVDGHERRSKYNRINQNGPEEMGWRTTAQNFNLNRDYVKLDTPEMRALVSLYSKWLPDFYVDTHTTDGADYQYTITYDVTKNRNLPEKTTSFIRKKFIPYAEKYVEDSGFLISPYVGFIRGDVKNGIRDWVAGPRFSQGYAAVRNRPGLLIETHMLKPYKDRVFSTKSLLEAVINFVSSNAEELIGVNKAADKSVVDKYVRHKKEFPLAFSIGGTPKFYNYKGIEFEKRYGAIAGDSIKFYTGRQFTAEVPYYYQDSVTASVSIPAGYVIPPEYKFIAEKLIIHGAKIIPISEEKKFKVEEYKFSNVKFPKFPYESHFRPSFEISKSVKEIEAPKGSFFVPADQPAVGIIVHCLEPLAEDSFVKWGFFNRIFERKEYFEMYSMEPIAEKMYSENPKLRREFDLAVRNDEKLKDNPRARLNWFYERSEYYDKKFNVYPILRIIK